MLANLFTTLCFCSGSSIIKTAEVEIDIPQNTEPRNTNIDESHNFGFFSSIHSPSGNRKFEKKRTRQLNINIKEQSFEQGTNEITLNSFQGKTNYANTNISNCKNDILNNTIVQYNQTVNSIKSRGEIQGTDCVSKGQNQTKQNGEVGFSDYVDNLINSVWNQNEVSVSESDDDE